MSLVCFNLNSLLYFSSVLLFHLQWWLSYPFCWLFCFWLSSPDPELNSSAYLFSLSCHSLIIFTRKLKLIMWYFPMLVSLNTMAEKEYPMVEDIQPFGGVSHSALLFQVSCISVFCFIGRGSSSRAAYSGRLSPQQHWTEKTMHSWKPLLFPSLC